jgi:digeranylgeranylglycerophospholipid reductase
MERKERIGHVVVGAGPAGCLTALELLRRGVSGDDVLLLESREADAYGRYHQMCAGGISSAGVASLGLDISGMVQNQIRAAREYWPGDIVLEGEASGFIIDRTMLLSSIRDEIARRGGKIVTDRIGKALRDGRAIGLECHSGRKIWAEIVYGADGTKSVIRRDLFGWKPQMQILAEQHLVPTQGNDTLEFDFSAQFAPKYQWTFPCGKISHIGFPHGSRQAPEGSVLRIVRPIPIGAQGAIASENACLIGDAACQANPLTFGGIRNGMEAGRMAAKAALDGNLQEYEGAWAASPLADNTFHEAFEILKNLSDDERAALMGPLRAGGGIMPVMQALMVDERFRVVYRAHVRKLMQGW